MASTDAKPIPQKNVAYRVTFPIFDADGDLVTGATGLDSEVSKDAGTFADCTNEATEIATSSGMYYLDLTSTEMNADTVAIIVKTSTSGAKTTPIVLYPEEAGDIRVNATQLNGTSLTGRDIGASVLLSSGTGTGQVSITSGVVSANAVQLSGDSVAADNAESFFDGTGYAGTNNVIPTVTTTTNLTNAPTAGDFTTTMKTSLNAATPSVTVSDKTGFSLSAAGIQAIWDRATSALTTVGSIGKLIVDNLDAAISSRLASASYTAPLDAAGTRSAIGLASANLDTQLDAIPTAAENSTAVWGAGTRILTAGTNIVLAKGTGITGFNDLSAAQVNAEVDTALADIRLDELLEIAATADPAAGSFLGDLLIDDAGTYQFTTNALENAPTGGSAPTVGQIADAVWDEAISGHLGAGSTGAALNAAGSSGDPWATPLPGAYGAGTAGNIVGTNLDATVSSRSTLDGTGVQSALTAQGYTTTRAGYLDTLNGLVAAIWSHATRILTAGTNIVLAKGTGLTGFNDLSAADVRTAVGLASANLDTQLADLPTNAELASEINSVQADIAALNNLSAAQVNAEIDTALLDVGLTTTVTGRIDVATSTRLASASYTAPDNATIATRASQSSVDTLATYVDTEVAAIKAKTDNLPAAPAAVGDIPTVAQIVAGVFGQVIEGAVTFIQSVRLGNAANAGKVNGAATTTINIRDLGDTKNRITATVDADGNRTAVTRDLT